MDGKVERILFDMFSDIDTIIAELFEMLFWDMLNQPADEVHGGQGFFHILVILMAVVMKGNRVIYGIVFINTGSGNDQPSEIAANVFHSLSCSGSLSKKMECLFPKSIYVIIYNNCK